MSYGEDSSEGIATHLKIIRFPRNGCAKYCFMSAAWYAGVLQSFEIIKIKHDKLVQCSYLLLPASVHSC